MTLVTARASELTGAQEKIERGSAKLEPVLDQSIEALASLTEPRDPYTIGHQRRVAELALNTPRDMGLDNGHCKGIRVLPLVHDLGNISVPAEILSAPRRLTEIERRLRRMHREVAAQLLPAVAFARPIADIVLQHHDQLGGSRHPADLEEGQVLLAL